MTRKIGLWLAVGLLGVAVASCGDDGGGDGDDEAAPMGEACFSPGVSMNCICAETGVTGARECMADSIWGA